MNLLDKIIKYKQTVLMIISLLLVLMFFIPWIINNPDLETFAYSEIQMSGFNLFTGYHELMPTVSQLLVSLDLKMISNLLYFGYLLILFPILGIVALILSGIRHRLAPVVHTAHYVFSLFLLLPTFLGIVMLADLRTMFFSIFGFSIGFYLSMITAVLGCAMIIVDMKYSPKK